MDNRLIKLLLLPVLMIVFLDTLSASRTSGSFFPKSNITHYDVKLDIDIEKQFVEARFNIDYIHKEATTSSLQIFLNKSFDIKKLTASHLQKSDIETSSISDQVNAITLHFDRAIQPGERISIQIKYAGQLRQEDMPFAVDNISAEWLELSVNSFWHPVFAGFTTYFTADVDLELSQQLQVVSSGEVTPKGKKRRIRNTIPQLDITFCASPEFLKRAEGKLTIFYSNPQQPFLDELVKYGSESIAFLNDWLGENEPIPYGKLVITPRAETGYARKHFIVLSNLEKSNAAHLSNFIAHEFAHFWWLKGDPNTSANWLNESFAEYTAMQYQRDYLGEEAFQREIADKRKRVIDLPPVIDGSGARQQHGVLYHKGPLKLYELELRIGKERMRNLLATINDANVRTTEALLKVMERELGKELTEQFSAMLQE